ncbi:hypothetical protein BaRGS_00011299 [Batillaria attramentaria]|uniref:RING-type domain-containing protein n=1 Tax=Batillaria attramentaria TaxID=370345 RepID=A0ABD0LEJ9_9CAEN
MEQNSQVRRFMPLSPVMSTLHVYPATPVYDDYCANPWMRPEMLRVGSFRGVALQEDSPLRLAGDGYYIRRTIVCFCCGSSWPFHRNDCRRMLLNIPFNQGVGQPPEPSTALQGLLLYLSPLAKHGEFTRDALTSVEDSVPIVGGVDHAVLLLILILVISRTDPMVNGFYRRKRDDEKDLYDRYLGKGMEQNSQVRIYMPLSPVLSTLHVYPATPVYDDYCANPWMRPEMLRVGSFRGVALQEDSPLRLAGDGYYFRRHDTTIVCFCCGSSWPFHRHDCRRMLLNIPFNQGVGQPPEPSMALQDFICRGVIRVRDNMNPEARPAPRSVQATETATIQADISLRQARAEDVHHGRVHRGGGYRGIAGSPARAPLYRGPDTVLQTLSAGSLPDPHGLCTICCRRRLQCRFLPCGHRVCCLQCAHHQRVCPQCRLDVQYFRRCT